MGHTSQSKLLTQDSYLASPRLSQDSLKTLSKLSQDSLKYFPKPFQILPKYTPHTPFRVYIHLFSKVSPEPPLVPLIIRTDLVWGGILGGIARVARGIFPPGECSPGPPLIVRTETATRRARYVGPAGKGRL